MADKNLFFAYLSDRCDLRGKGRFFGMEVKMMKLRVIYYYYYLIWEAALGQEPRVSAALQMKNQVEAHGKGSMGLAAAATDKVINTLLYLGRDLRQPGRWRYIKKWRRKKQSSGGKWQRIQEK